MYAIDDGIVRIDGDHPRYYDKVVQVCLYVYVHTIEISLLAVLIIIITSSYRMHLQISLVQTRDRNVCFKADYERK